MKIVQPETTELRARLRRGIALKSELITQKPGGVIISHDLRATEKTMKEAAQVIEALERQRTKGNQ